MTELDPSLAAERLTELWVGHRQTVGSFIRRRLPSHLVEDAVVDVFTVAWQKIDSAPAEPRGWLLAIARNVVGTHLRSSGRWTALTIRTADHLVEETASAEDRGIERVTLQRAWNALSNGEREVLALAAWDGLTSNEAAVVLGCLRSTYSVRLTRARRHLRTLLEAPIQQPASRSAARLIGTTAPPRAMAPDQTGPILPPDSEGVWA